MGLVSHIPHQEFLQVFLTILPFYHLHTSLLTCTQNMYQFCLKLKSNDSLFTDILINNTSHYAFMYCYCYACQLIHPQIKHCMITTCLPKRPIMIVKSVSFKNVTTVTLPSDKKKDRSK